MKAAHTLGTIAAALLLAVSTGYAREDVSFGSEPVDYSDYATDEFGDDYGSGDYGRIRYLENGVTVIRGFSSDYSPAEIDGSVNAPIYPEDSVRTGPRERVEVQLARGSMVRLDEGSELTFQALPDPYAEFQDNTVLGLHEGLLRIHAVVGDDEVFRIDTPAASIYLLGDADLRVEVGRDGETRVLTYRGVAELAADGGSILVRGGMSSVAYPDAYPEESRPFNTMAGDSFDRWVRERESTYLASDRYMDDYYREEVYEDLPGEVRPYYAELSSHGRWVHVHDYGWCWLPVDVEAGWRPYRAGYWHYGPHGYFWVSHEPWGWAPYHYGRWDWVSGLGWTWIPGRRFAGAWVSWSWGTAYVGWAPLGYWNRAVVVGDVYYGHYSSHSWTFVSYTHIRHRHGYHRYAVPVERIGPRHGHAIVTRPPRVSPRDLAGDREARRRAHDDADRRKRVVRNDRPNAPRRRFRDGEDVAIRTGRVKWTRVADSDRPGRDEAPPRAGRPGGAVRKPPVNRDSRKIPVREVTDGRVGKPAPRTRPRTITRPRDEERGSKRNAAPRSRPAAPRNDVSKRVQNIYDWASRPPGKRPGAQAPKRGAEPKPKRPDDPVRSIRPVPESGRRSSPPSRKPPAIRNGGTDGRRSLPSRPSTPRVRTGGNTRKVPTRQSTPRVRTGGNTRKVPTRSTPPSARPSPRTRTAPSRPSSPPRVNSGGRSKSSPAPKVTKPTRSKSSRSTSSRPSSSRSSTSRSKTKSTGSKSSGKSRTGRRR